MAGGKFRHRTIIEPMVYGVNMTIRGEHRPREAPDSLCGLTVKVNGRKYSICTPTIYSNAPNEEIYQALKKAAVKRIISTSGPFIESIIVTAEVREDITHIPI